MVQYTISTFLNFAHYIVLKKEYIVLKKYLSAKSFILFEYETVDKEQKTRTLPEIIDLRSPKITEKMNNRN